MSAARGFLALAAVTLLAACSGDNDAVTTPRNATRPRLTVDVVGIDGSNRVQRFADCFWAADISGGTAPFTYTWRNSGIVGTSFGDTFEGQMVGSGGIMRVKVTDSLGAQDSAALTVIGDPNGQC
jgi:hypothetical protein